MFALSKEVFVSRAITAACVLTLLAASHGDALARQRSQSAKPVDALVRIEPPGSAQPRFFTINQVLAQRDGTSPRGPIRLASIDVASLRGSFSELPRPVVASAESSEPFGLSTFRAPNGLLWSKWRGVEGQIQRDIEVLRACRADRDQCPPEARRYLAVIESASAHEGRRRLDEINRAINMSVRYTSDLVQHGLPDVWSSPLATFATGRGDCEDYAIAKYVALLETGVSGKDMRILLGNDTSVREAHAVLAVRQGGHWLVLDNRRSVILEDGESRHLVPLFAIDREGVKLFAAPYASRQSPIEVAPASEENSIALPAPGPAL
jgi:predicted transglutaminase-like cysteine proteinase